MKNCNSIETVNTNFPNNGKEANARLREWMFSKIGIRTDYLHHMAERKGSILGCHEALNRLNCGDVVSFEYRDHSVAGTSTHTLQAMFCMSRASSFPESRPSRLIFVDTEGRHLSFFLPVKICPKTGRFYTDENAEVMVEVCDSLTHDRDHSLFVADDMKIIGND